jgi:hypothetical protein
MQRNVVLTGITNAIVNPLNGNTGRNVLFNLPSFGSAPYGTAGAVSGRVVVPPEIS